MKLLTILAVLLASVMPASAGPSSDAWFGKLTGEYQCQGGWRNTGITVQFRKYATKANEISLSGALAMVDERYDLNLRGRKDVILNGKHCRPRIDEGHQREEQMMTYQEKQLKRALDALDDIMFKSTDSWAVERARKAFDERTPLNEP